MKKIYKYLVFSFSLVMFVNSMQAQTYTMTNGTVNSCSGTFLDPGGAGQYANSISFTQTICSTNGLPAYLQFTTFATESGFDVVTIYNGPNTASPVIGTYSGGANPGTVTATGTCITIRFTTDGSVTAAGWSATIGCGTPPPPPPPPAGAGCSNPNSFCGSPITYPAGTGGTPAPAGPSYGCLGSQPNPAWFNMQVASSGPMTFNISAASDIDYIIWGPFTTPTGACLAGLTAGNIVSCSYSATNNEFGTIPNAIVGQFYIMLITNFSGASQTISLVQSAGTGTANCNILCNITGMTGTPGACQPASNTFNVNGTITTTSPPSSGTLTITSSCGGTPLVLNPPFSTSTNYTLTGIPTGTGTCTLTASYSADATCTRTVTVTAPPPCTSCNATANNTGPYCPNGTINLAATATVVPTSTLTTTYSWSGPNSYSGSGQNISIPAATAAMGGVYTVTATTGTTTCTATTNVIVNPTPIVTVTSPSVCLGGSTNITAGGAVNYIWSAGTTPGTGATVSVTPAVTESFTVTGIDANGCAGTNVSTVTVYSNPSITVTSPTICIGDTATITAMGAAGYAWSAGTTPASGSVVSANPATTTSYIVTGTDLNGCIGTATSTVTVNPLPVVTASSATVCATFSAVLNAGGATVYSWSVGTTPATGATVTVTPVATESFTVTGTDANGCINTAISAVTVNNAPIVTVNSATICINTTTPLTANGATTYTWDPPTGLDATTGGTVNANPVITTTYTVIGTDANGCVDTTNVTVTVNPLPIVDAGLQDTVCLGNFTSLNATGAMSYLWAADPSLNSTISPSPVATPTATTNYTVTGTDGNGCSATDNVTLIVPPTFSLTTNAIPALCFGSSNGAASVTANPSSGPFASYTYLWQTGSTAAIISGLTANTYSVSVRDLASCLQTATVTITEPTALVVTQTTNTPVSCNGGNDGTATISAAGGTPSYTYSWSPSGGSAPTATGLSAGSYTVSTTDVNACVTLLPVTITEPQPVVITLSANPTICLSQSATLTASATGGNGSYTFSWSDGVSPVQTGSSVTVSPSVTTNYTVTATDLSAAACSSVNQPVITVTVNPPLVINSISNASICQTKFVIKDVTGSGGNGNHTFTWSPMTGVTLLNANGSSAKLQPSVSTVYNVTIHDNCGTSTANTSFSVTVNPTPTLSITPLVTSGCAPLVVNFTGISNPASAQCTWSFGGIGTSANCSPVQQFVQDGSYTILYSVTDINGCENSTSSNVVVYPVPQAAFVASPQPTTIIDPVVTFTDVTFANVANQTWFFNDSINSSSTLSTPSYTYLTAGTYSVTLAVETDHGCVDTVTQNVYISDYYAIYVPNAFSPDGDGVNDEFYALGTGITELETVIYDRWGGKIFSTNELEKGWDGKDGSDKKVAKGIYIYKILATNFLGEKKIYTGHVTVVR